MATQQRFDRWAAVGMPLFLALIVAALVVVHFGYRIPWTQLPLPAFLCAAIQSGYYLGEFWAGKQAREKGRVLPMALLRGVYLWAICLVAYCYGSAWGILPPSFHWLDFAIVLAALTLIVWLLAVWFAKKLHSTYLNQTR